MVQDNQEPYTKKPVVYDSKACGILTKKNPRQISLVTLRTRKTLRPDTHCQSAAERFITLTSLAVMNNDHLAVGVNNGVNGQFLVREETGIGNDDSLNRQLGLPAQHCSWSDHHDYRQGLSRGTPNRRRTFFGPRRQHNDSRAEPSAVK